MMRAKNKGLDDSIWASRGKSSNYYNSSSTYRSRPNPPPTSVITPATPQPPSPTKLSGNGSVNTSNNPPPTTATPNSNTPRSVTPNPSTAITNGTKPSSSSPSSQQEFKRYIQIVRRLKWKLPYLSHGYHLAIAKPGDPLFGGETNAQEAELMFKLDFYEYYMLLERALVHLLGVFGIAVPRDVNERWMPPAARAGGGYSTHTYHENVLAALQREDSPLHEALGSGEVLFHLSRAKELRNRWKYAEEASGAKKKEETGRRRDRDGTAPLESYDLDRIFTYVFAGFDAGYAVAERRVAEDSGVKAGEQGGFDFGKEMEIEEDEFDFMVEAMDWEAV